MKYEELNGLGDTFDRGYGSVWSWYQDTIVKPASELISEAALTLTEATGTTQTVSQAGTWVEETAGQITASAKAKIKEFEEMMNKLLVAQKQVDEGIESMPEGPEKQRLAKLRDENRGAFSTYILPAWEQFRQWAGIDTNANYGNTQFGIAITGTMVVTIGAVVSVISVALPYIYSNYKIEQQILNDPELKKTYAASRGSLFSLGGLPGYVGLGIAGLAGIYLLSSSGLLSKKR